MENLMHHSYVGRMLRLLCSIALLGVASAMTASAGKLVLKIQAVNKSDSEQQIEIRSSLPSRITNDDIIDLAGLNLGYDVKSDTYYVYDSVQLAPKEVLVRDVEMNDIWVIDAAELATYRKRASDLGGLLSGTKYSQESDAAKSVVLARSDDITTRQTENGIASVGPIRHIQAYEANLKALQELKQNVGKMENLAMAAGLNPGDMLIGDDLNAAIPRRDVHFPEQYGEALYRISVHNSSATRPRKIEVRKDMPPEITIDDVIDAGGLGVGYDPKARVSYVYKDQVEIPPSETITFEVRIRDKWNINSDRMTFLQAKANELLVMTSGRANIEAVENSLKLALEALDEVMAAKGPETLSPAYISFYRRQADSLDGIEQDLNRVDAALKPLETKRGFDIPAPDKRTTWLIIYVILGFLALVSLLFFLRWFVRSS
jgi:hypothetical protein